jgi:bifunctional DNA-binding transcriptional regulator/antitoxin component of YhaV-PrlF toxin-antitoxin module
MAPTGKIVSKKYVRVRDRNQITLPTDILEALPIRVGDFLELVLTDTGVVEMIPTKLITSMNSPGARDQEALADKDIAEKNYGTFHTADELIDHATRGKRRKKKVAIAAAAASS